MKFEASIIIPVFNEEERIKPFLKELKLESRNNWEMIFVDDGSRDKSLDLIKNSGIANLKIVSYQKNRGKGYAVRKGVEASNGKYVLFIDADGSIHPSEIKKMLLLLKKHDFVVGNRASKDSEVEQPLLRKFFGFCFNAYSNFLFGLSIRDKLCGFKGFKSATAKKLFRNLESDRWIFDIEIFFKAKNRGIEPHRMPIKWEHRDKSRMKPYDPLKIALDLVLLRLKMAIK